MESPLSLQLSREIVRRVMKKEKSNCIGRRIVMSGAVALRESELPLFHNYPPLSFV